MTCIKVHQLRFRQAAGDSLRKTSLKWSFWGCIWYLYQKINKSVTRWVFTQCVTIKLSIIHIRNDLPGKTWAKTYFILISTSYSFLNWIRFSNYWFKWRLLQIIGHKLLVKFDQFHHEFSNTCCSMKIWQGIMGGYDFWSIKAF